MPKNKFPPQRQKPPGIESKMVPKPQYIRDDYRGSGKLTGKVAVVTGADSGIGRSVAAHFAQEGADVVALYLNEHGDAAETAAYVKSLGRKCLLIDGDIGQEKFCKKAIAQAVDEFGKIDILVNNAGEQRYTETIEDIRETDLERMFRTNIFSMFFLTKAAMPHLRPGSVILNTTSVTAFKGSPKLLDYSSTKGAIVSFTRSLALSLIEKKIRVNAVAPGPVWTPLQTHTWPVEKIMKFGSSSEMGRAGQPAEVGPCYVFLASADSTFMTGQVLHPNGGEIV